MSSPPLYKDIDKDATSILTQGFPIDKISADFEGSPTSSFKFKVSSSKTAGLNASAFEVTSICPKGVTVKYVAKVEKNRPVHEVEVSNESQCVKGLKTTLLATFDASSEGKGNTAGRFTGVYRDRGLVGEFGVVPEKQRADVSSSISGIYSNIKWGLTGILSLGRNEFKCKQAGVKLQYNPSSDTSLTGFYNYVLAEAPHTIGARVFHKSSSSPIEFSGEVICKPDRLNEPPVFSAGLSYLYDSSTLKAKINSEGSLFSSIKHQINPTVGVTFGSEIKALSQPPKFGASVNFKL